LVAKFGAFTNIGAGGISLDDGEALTIGGVVKAGTGNLSLTTTSGGIAVDFGLVTDGTLTLVSAGSISQAKPKGAITAGELTGSAVGSTTLNDTNKIGSLGDFTSTGGNFSLTDAISLTAAGTVNAGAFDLSLKDTTGDLDITGELEGNQVTLGSGKGQVTGTGAIIANVLEVTADTGIDLTGDNDIGKIKRNHTNSGPDVINNP
jgi:fibronectin-binding autotransporter adhesin